MVTLALLVLPMPLKLRGFIVNSYNKALTNQNLRTSVIIGEVLVGLLFADSLKRAAQPLPTESAVSFQALATKSYNQRNVYLAGFVLFFSIAIPTVLSVQSRVVKYQRLNLEKATGESADEAEKHLDEEIAKLEKELALKETDLAGLKAQKTNLEKQFDSLTEKESTGDKKEN